MLSSPEIPNRSHAESLDLVCKKSNLVVQYHWLMITERQKRINVNMSEWGFLWISTKIH